MNERACSLTDELSFEALATYTKTGNNRRLAIRCKQSSAVDSPVTIEAPDALTYFSEASLLSQQCLLNLYLCLVESEHQIQMSTDVMNIGINRNAKQHGGYLLCLKLSMKTILHIGV